MKVAFYYDLPPGGALIHTLGFLKELKKYHQVEVISPTPPLQSHRLLRDLQALFWSRQIAKKLAARINQEFDLVYVTHDRFFQAPWILRYLRIPSLFYCHNPTLAYFVPELGISPNWPFLNRLYEAIIRSIKKRIEITNARHASLTITSSKYMAGLLKTFYHVSAKVVYPGIDKLVFHPLHLSKSRQAVLVGNDETQKSLDLAIDSLVLVPASIRPALILASPRHPLSKAKITQAAKMGVKLISKVGLTQREMNKLYNSSLLTLAVSFREGFGYSPVESTAAGTPVIAVKDGGYLETVQNHVNGYLVDRTPNTISSAILSLLKKPLQLSGITTFTLQSSNKKLLNLLSQLPKYHLQKND